MRRPRGRSHCPINFTLELVGDSWSLLIVRDIMFERKRRYKDFLESPEGIATNILADRLAKLERYGIIEKLCDEYYLTRKGLDLLPVLTEMIGWGSRHDPKTAAPQRLVDLAHNDPARFRKAVKAATGSSGGIKGPG
jgi:DNA-binding HxlR family transcriptional regulator